MALPKVNQFEKRRDYEQRFANDAELIERTPCLSIGQRVTLAYDIWKNRHDDSFNVSIATEDSNANAKAKKERVTKGVCRALLK